jgi:cell division protein FtsN
LSNAFINHFVSFPQSGGPAEHLVYLNNQMTAQQQVALFHHQQQQQQQQQQQFRNGQVSF